MLISIDLWRSKIGNFNGSTCSLRQPCRFKLLNLAFWHLFTFIIKILKLLLVGIRQYLLLYLYCLCLVLWCAYYCVIHRILNASICLVKHQLVSLYSNLWWMFLLIVVSNPRLLNPGPAPSPLRKHPLKILHLNPNSIIAHDGARIHAIEALNTIHNYDVIAITESALHSSISNDVIQLNGFIPIRRDLPDDITHGGVLLYHKESLAVRERPDLETFSNMLVCEVTINQKNIYFCYISQAS